MRRTVASRGAGASTRGSALADVLLRAEEVDLEFIVGLLKGPLGFSADHAMDGALQAFAGSNTVQTKRALVETLDREIRYAASSDFAYLLRWLWTDHAGVSPERLLTDVSEKLGVKIRTIGPFEAKLQKLVRSVAEKELLTMTAEQQQELIATQGLGETSAKELLRHIKQKGPLSGLPLLITLAGREAGERIATAAVTRLITLIVGRHAALPLIKNLAIRFPWWADWIGPAAWALTGAWVAHDLQGPAYRKTIPVTLYAGLVSMRIRPVLGAFEPPG
jgi:uncharacterized protein YaaW (UPF0174 family)